MSRSIRTIRFGRVATQGSAGNGAVSDVFVDSHTIASGRIFRLEHEWVYLRLDGTATGLSSSRSREDLERKVTEHYFKSGEADAQAPLSAAI